MGKTNYLIILLLFTGLTGFGQNGDDEYYSKVNSIDLYYIPKNIRSNIRLGKGYDMSDPWFPVPADVSPFLTVPPKALDETLKAAFQPKVITLGTSSQEYKMHYEDHIDERTVAQFYYADLKVRGIAWDMEAAMQYVSTEYNISQGVRFVLENNSTLPDNLDIDANWKTEPVTEKSTLDDKGKWKLFKGKYGSHYISSFSYGYRIEIIAFANTSIKNSKLSLNAAFNSFCASGKFTADISDDLKQSGANVDVEIFCQDIKNVKTGSEIPFIITGIANVMQFLQDLNDNVVQITSAPTSVSFKSYFASVCSNYPVSCKLFDTKITPVDTNAVPRGTIFAWTPPPQNIQITNGRRIIIPPQGRWAICDSMNHQLNSRIPDLSNRFILGTDNPKEISDTGGSKSHTHSVTVSGANYGPGGKGKYGYSDPHPTGTDHTHNVKISTESNMPPYYKAVYIMKL